MAIRKATTTDDLVKAAEPVADGYTALVGPTGTPTTVPNSIVEALLDSGYTRK